MQTIFCFDTTLFSVEKAAAATFGVSEDVLFTGYNG
jgi:hypothetical protein